MEEATKPSFFWGGGFGRPLQEICPWRICLKEDVSSNRALFYVCHCQGGKIGLSPPCSLPMYLFTLALETLFYGQKIFGGLDNMVE